MNNLVDTLFKSGHAADIILAVMLLEGMVLALIYRRAGKGIAPMDLVFSLGAGVGLVLALRAALTDAHWVWIAAALMLSFAFHIGDMLRRAKH